MQVDSKPEELDSIDREIVRLKIEQEALKKESDPGSKERLKNLEKELASLEKQSADLTARWQAEKNKLVRRAEAQDRARSAARRTRQRAAQGRIPARRRTGLWPHPRAREEAQGRSRREGKGAMVEEAVTADHVAQVVSRWTGVPVDQMLEGEKEKLLRMEERSASASSARPRPCKAVSTAVRRARAGLQDPHRPIGSFMFLGPTGVGKTELTKALAEFLFDDETALIRIDMSEYMEKHSVARLIGAPPGYVGYEEGGALTEAVRRRPYQVDPVRRDREGAPGRVQRAAAGARRRPPDRRPGPHGRLPQHADRDDLEPRRRIPGQPAGGQDTDAVRDQVMAVVRASFRPEFLNRVDEIILFHRLKRSEMSRIVDIQMRRLQKLLDERKITITLDAGGARLARREGLGPGLWRAAARSA